jgi:SAM-dependent methyltransferase
MPTRAEALDYPRRDLLLGFCPACGFVCNTVFDPAVHEYSTRYEETQGFSPTFNAFARSLAQRWVDRYDLHSKTLLEIGCGKGEFLALLCELGANDGIGIDPSYVPSRMTSPASSRIRFIQDLYSEKYAHLKADFVCCRHTLEHIAPTGDFLAMVRRAIGESPGTAVCFELPDVLRVLKEGAFWDIYYEHCSYFSPGSLARLFRRNAFDVTHLELDYDDQYILIDARPVSGPTLPRLPLEDDLTQMSRLVSRFRDVCQARIEGWRSRIAESAARGQRTVVWGSGSKGVAFLTTLGVTEGIECVVDINPHKHGRFMPGTGHEIVPPEHLRTCHPDCVIVMNPIYVSEIRRDLERLSVQAELLAV